MLIYAVADLHGRFQRMQRVRREVAIHRPDVLVLAGDISTPWQPAAMLDTLNCLNLPVLLVRGNSDRRDLVPRLRPFARLRSVHLRRARFNGLEIVGIDGTLPLPFHSRLGFRETELVARVSGMLRPHSVLVVHPPPYGIRDRVLGRFHAGSRAVRRLVNRCSPALVVCGHIHEQAGVETIGPTTVVNCAMGRSGGGALIRYDGQSTPACTMLPPDR
ncbi:metallophosphoesterase [Desulfosarcina alkanivorans]|jgi:Icc-related predicted phosphoesterase|uniref:Metallophosphoesterase n=1 Tax=Desulfosarcina alkanivorans TaxID=571177 RepID=A0A5K7YW00_9BACT|nr:metallophosphoesterase [Desulfosarcina alkanivorans]BBO71251.1 metallophosphoesterase [Desulfosarcina alkanivorans]